VVWASVSRSRVGLVSAAIEAGVEEHVFCTRATSMTYASGNKGSWPGWQKYTNGLPAVKGFTVRREFRLVQVGSSNVLLFKSETHLDFPGKA
jgi:hypothetical protein